MKKNNSILLSTPYIVWMVVFTLIPLGVVGYYALTDPATGVFTFENLKDLGMYMPVLWQSIWYSLISAFICLLLGYPVAYYIAHQSVTMQKILYMLVMLPMCMSFLLRTLAWVGLLQDTGIINDILDAIGIGRIQMIRTPGAVVLGMVYNFIPFMILQIHSSLAKMDKSLIEAANDLGANPMQSFLKVTLPLSLPGVLSGITLVFLPAVSSFFIPKLLGGGQYVLVGNVIETQFLTSGDWNFGAAISLIMAIIIMISMWLTRKVDTDPASNGKGA